MKKKEKNKLISRRPMIRNKSRVQRMLVWNMWPLSSSARKRLAAMPAGSMLRPTANYFARTFIVLKGGFTISKQEMELVCTKYQANW